MKNRFKNIFVLAVCTMLLWSCKKDEEKNIYNGTKAGVVFDVSSTTNSGTNAIALAVADANKTALTLAWNNPDYQFSDGISSQNVTYTVEIDTAGANFASTNKQAIAPTVSYDLGLSLTEDQLNSALAKLGLKHDAPASFDVRVIATLGGIAATKVISKSTLNFNTTTYFVEPVYPSLGVPGDYWNPTWSPKKETTTPRLYDLKGDGIYMGYVYFSGAGLHNFKFTGKDDWTDNYNYGDGGAGKLDNNSAAGNIQLTTTGADYYLFTVDINAKTWTSLETHWAIIGDAADGWSTDVPLVYDAGSNTLKLTRNLNAGPLKFRSNGTWDAPNPNYGDNGADGILDLGGDNITVASAGNYTITLDLHYYPKITYDLHKN